MRSDSTRGKEKEITADIPCTAVSDRQTTISECRAAQSRAEQRRVQQRSAVVCRPGSQSSDDERK